MSKFKHLLTMAIVAMILIIPNTNSYASTTCIDLDKDGYCDTCGKTMDEGLVVATGSVQCAHTHYGSGGRTSPNGCYDEAYSNYEKVGEKECGKPVGGGSYTNSGWCVQCGNDHCCGHEWGACSNGHNLSYSSGYCDHTENIYGYVTRYRCTKTTIDCGIADMIKTGNNLSIKIALDPSVTCVITGYKWTYGSSVISTSATAATTSVGKYTCTISYTATDAHGRVTSATTTLVYDAPITAFTNNAFHIEKSATDTGYNLKFVQNSDYMSYYTLSSLKWTYAKNAQTWDILPFKSGSETNNPLFVQNCGDYTCTYVIKGNDGSTYTHTLTYSLNSFDARIAANLATSKKESFACTWDYFSLQNIYSQAEKLTIADTQNGGSTLAKTPIMVFDDDHNLKDSETIEAVVKTYNGVGNNVSEIIRYDCTFVLSDYVLGTCTKKGTSTVTATVTASVYFKDSSSGNTYFSYSVPVSSYSIKEVGKNIKNHDCVVKSYEWKDNNGDAINDYLYITRDCPASNGNWLITVNLWPEDTDFKDELFTISHVEQIYSKEDECKTVYTTVIYEYLKGKYVTYSTTDNAKHVYTSVYTPADCINIGHRDYTCDYCGHEYSVKTSEPLGHYYIWKTTKPMTLDEDGESTGTCNRCGAVTTKIIPSIHTALQQRTSFTNIPIFDPSIYEKQLNSKDPFNRTQYYWDLLKLYRNPSDNRSPWEWNGDIGKYVWNGTDKPWEWKSAIGRYSFMTDETLWEWNSDIGKYVWNGEGDEYSFGAGIRIGNGLIPRFDSLSLLSKSGDTNMDLSITSYGPKEDEKETLLDKLKDVIRDIMNALRNLINFFREHPVLTVISILLFILIVAGIVLYVLVKKDRIKFKKVNENQKK